MKFNFKKITSVLASAVMLGSTMGIAAAGTYPAPFVSGGVDDVSIVVGAASPNNVDWAPGVAIGNALSTELSSQTAGTSSTGTTASGGDSLKIEKSQNKLNMNDAITDVWTTKITSANLPTLLADKTFRSKDNVEYQYEQYIDLFEYINFTHFEDNDYKEDTPALGIRFGSTANVLNYTLNFKKYPRSDVVSDRLEDIEDRDITILGKTYRLLNAYNKSSDTKFELMRGSVSDTINLNEEKTEKLDDKTYTVTLVYVDATYAQFDIVDSEGNSQTTTKLAKGGTYKLVDGTQLGVTDLSYQNFAGGVMNAEFTLGADKLTIENGQVVEVNDVDVTGLVGYISRSEVDANKVDITKIVIQWTTDDEEYVAEDSTLLMPGFGALKLTYGGFYTPCEEKVSVKAKSTFGIELVVPIKDGDATFSILDGTATDFNSIGDDTDGTGILRTGSNLTGDVITFDKDTDDYFVASWNDSTSAESYLLKVTSVTNDTAIGGGTDKVTIRNIVTGTDYTDKKKGDIITIGNVELTVDELESGGKTATFTISSGGTFNRIYTAGGLGIWLPINCSTGEASECTNFREGGDWSSIFNVSLHNGNETTWELKMTEEDKDGNLGAGDIINVTLGHASSEAEPTDVAAASTNGFSAGVYKEIGDTKEYEGYLASDLGTRTLIKKPTSGQNSVDIIYHCGESYGEIYLTAPEVSISGADGTGTELGSVTYYDNELTATQKAKNLVVVGGSCVNTVAAELLGGSLCAAQFTAKTGVGKDQFLVEVFNNPYTTGKIAMLVAGYQAADTAKAATYVTKETPVDTTVGTKLKKVTATYADVV